MNKKIKILTIIILLILTMNTKTLAREIRFNNSYETQSGQVEFVQTTSNMKFSNDSKVSQMTSIIFGTVQYLCMAAAMIVLIIKGVQFMSAAPEGKAEIKKQMVAIVVGAVIVFTIDKILRIILGMKLF